MKYQDKLLRSSQASDKTKNSLSGIRYQISAHSKLVTESGSDLPVPQSDQVVAAATTNGFEADNPALKEKSASTPEAKLAIPHSSWIGVPYPLRKRWLSIVKNPCRGEK